ncbi:MAG: 3-methyladenine DNA glycosylase [Micrococcales bacterium]|nr:3-methyladenine DNA glycosylase [Micrococcales bacterium]
MIVWEQQTWRDLEEAHHARVDAASGGHLQRRRRGASHPVEDFLWVYYRYRPAQLRRWHPGPGVGLADAVSSDRPTWRYYRSLGSIVTLDVEAFVAARGDALRYVVDLLSAIAARPAGYGCFGLHEWAMVYGADETRHGWPLRLGAAGTDEVVRSRPLRCTHYDAFRFFTPQAATRNEHRPTLQLRSQLEQPGCVHAGMDCYKWAFTLAPGISSGLTMDCFDHARRAREVDMRASPYDLRDLGYEPIAVETPAGRAQYVQEQQALARTAAGLRSRLVQAARTLLDAARLVA